MEFKEIDEINHKNPDDFLNILEGYKQRLEKNRNENEPSIVANAMLPFFKSLGFDANIGRKLKGNSEIDLAILNIDSEVESIIECKKWNSTEMFSVDNTNCKALHECILYYMRERQKGNFSLRYIIISDFYNFYIFESSEFEKLKNDKEFYKFFKAFSEKKDPTKTPQTSNSIKI